MIKKLIKKAYGIPIYDFISLECWFADMAKKGLLLKKADLCRAHFEKTEPMNVIYHLDISLKSEMKPEEEVLEYYESCGWKYVDTIKEDYACQGYYHIYMSTEENPTEVQTDLVVQSYIYERLYKKIKNKKLLFLISPLVSMGLCVYLISDSPIFFMTTSNLFFSVIFVGVAYFYEISSIIWNYLNFKKRLIYMQVGMQVIHPQKYSDLKRMNQIKRGVVLIVSILFVLCFIDVNDTTGLKEYTEKLPTITLEELENNIQFRYDSDYEQETEKEKEENASDWPRSFTLIPSNFGNEWLTVMPSNYIETRSSILSPVQYEISQRGVVETMAWDHGGEYDPTISTSYYELSLNCLAEPLMRDIFKEYTSWCSDSPIKEEIESLEFDKVIFWKDVLGGQYFIINKDDFVVFVNYIGKVDLKANFDKLADAIVSYERLQKK